MIAVTPLSASTPPNLASHQRVELNADYRPGSMNMCAHAH
jgi:hypothetical protein